MSRPYPHERMMADNGAGWLSLAAIGEAVYRVWLRSPGGSWYRYEGGEPPRAARRAMPGDGGEWPAYLARVRDGRVRCIEGRADPRIAGGVAWRLAAASEGMTRPWHPGGARAVVCAALEAVRLAHSPTVSPE